jgi:membrane protease YdiL (CAAX protease family)
MNIRREGAAVSAVTRSDDPLAEDRWGGTTDGAPPTGAPPQTLAWETVLVVAIAIGVAAARSVLVFAFDATAPGGLSVRSAVLVGSFAPSQPWIDLGLQLVFLCGLVLPALLAVHLVHRSGDSLQAIGLRPPRLGRDIGLGLGIAAAIGAVGLAAYLISHAAGYSVTVVPAELPHVWWRGPVLVLWAVGNAVLEEVVLVGYLLRRCRQLGWSNRRSAALSAGIRGAYHLYQGLAGGIGNLAMGLVFARFYQRFQNILPLLVAHAVIDVVAFFGYEELAGHVTWLPVLH